MSKTNKSPKAASEIKAEYEFDLEPDVAQVFDTSESVNRALRSVISATPGRKRRSAIRKPRRKAG
jgi:hypothetical protein